MRMSVKNYLGQFFQGKTHLKCGNFAANRPKRAWKSGVIDKKNTVFQQNFLVKKPFLHSFSRRFQRYQTCNNVKNSEKNGNKLKNKRKLGKKVAKKIGRKETNMKI